MAATSQPEPSEHPPHAEYVPPRIAERTALDLPLIGGSGPTVCAAFFPR